MVLRHYLVTAVRGLAHHRLYTLINIAGLSIGLTCAILIALYVRDELSYDTWVPHTQNLYRLEESWHPPGGPALPGATAAFPAVTAIGEKSPQVEAVTHVVPEWATVNLGARQFAEQVTFVDSNFLRVIELPLVRGDPAQVLAQPETVVITQSIARKYFGDADPIGKTLTVGRDPPDACGANDSACRSGLYPLTVTGVLRDLPHNTQLVADLLIPNTSRADTLSPREKERGWRSSDRDYGYVELRRGADPAAALAQLKPILDAAWNPRTIGFDVSASEIMPYRLTPFLSVHLTSDRYGGMTPGGSWTTVYGLIAIAVLILLIACFNFMNLATARATLRAREIALRKVGGATRAQLIAQFLLEALLMALLSLVIALSLVEVLLPLYERFVDRTIGFRYLADWHLLAVLIGGTIVVGLVSGAYPAVVLSAFRPAPALKAGAHELGSRGFLRSALVVAQFAISIALGTAVLVVFRQIDFARKVDLGFDRDGVVVLRGVSRLTPSARKSFAAALGADPRIMDLAYSNAAPFDLRSIPAWSIRAPGRSEIITAFLVNADPGFPSLYGARLISGRLLSDARGEDVSTRTRFGNVLINATGARALGFTPDEAVGKKVDLLGPTVNIVGVLGDMKLRGAKGAIYPMLYYFDRVDPQALTMLSVRVRGEHLASTLSFIDKTWHAFAPGAAIDRYFLNDSFDGLFQSDEKQGEMLGVFVGIAIFIACLGLFGIAVFTAARRTQEIGVRKISGARITDIVRLVLWRISLPVFIANLVAWPVAYHYLRHWLDGYAYRITLSPVYFLIAGAAALLLAWTTVFAHTLHLARASPVHALRYE
ncbi:MAG: ABC transporter permease [Steroidobacteraceae bacterium]